MKVTTTTVYDRITHKTRFPFTCRVCGMRGSKTKTFGQTVNPFNKNARGEVKTVPEIREELRASAAAWRPDPVHGKCVP